MGCRSRADGTPRRSQHRGRDSRRRSLIAKRRSLASGRLRRSSLASGRLRRSSLASGRLRRGNSDSGHLSWGGIGSGRLRLGRLGLLASGRLAEDVPTPYQQAGGEHHRRQRGHGYGQVDQQQPIGEDPRGEQPHGHQHDRQDGAEPDQGRAPRAVLDRTMPAAPLLGRRTVLAEAGLGTG
jgi:hypothetical protein